MVDNCDAACNRVLYREAIYASDAFLVQQMEELAVLSGHWLIQVAAQRLKALELSDYEPRQGEKEMVAAN